ncbi:hypothetical protein LF1_49100 [Rubripirellula obstinata]|uniref:SHOCT domain-containing protein n=1 Tax=Rubripirellula obstinata TaxID=406547 RepID=A0A5B1CP75_9BACT|nr:SHOCT domain-containing protein [Rubripirellula obstinata]KAA1262346.1 hypothetical protein LF1_49100 [Rubripirellula obstinata]
MPNLSASGNQLVQSLAQRHGLSPDAVTHMLIAVSNGNGTMAQFNHPEFGGGGQWMQGGMTMVSDLFNNYLKNQVNNLCSDIANELANHQSAPFSGSFQSQSQNGSSAQSQAAGSMGSDNSLFVPDPSTNWWPKELGSPAAIGSQNQTRYAYFPNSRRLAVTTGGEAWVYDTLNHQIGGFSQQQGVGGSITFSSQFGTVDLSSLPVVSIGGVPQTAPSQPTPQNPAPQNPAPQNPEPAPPQASDNFQSEPDQSMNNAPPMTSSQPSNGNGDNDDVIGKLDRLGALKEKGYITDEEFATKKADLLGRL